MSSKTTWVSCSAALCSKQPQVPAPAFQVGFSVMGMYPQGAVAKPSYWHGPRPCAADKASDTLLLLQLHPPGSAQMYISSLPRSVRSCQTTATAS